MSIIDPINDNNYVLVWLFVLLHKEVREKRTVELCTYEINMHGNVYDECNFVQLSNNSPLLYSHVL